MKPLQRFLKPQDIEIIFVNIEVSQLAASTLDVVQWGYLLPLLAL
jgi:hypothetical protein